MKEVPEPARPQTDRLVTGVFLDHGPAPFKFKTNGAPSYYLKVQTDAGLRTLWGSGLKKALRHSRTRPKIGEPIGVRENGTAPATVQQLQQRARGRPVTGDAPRVPKSRWVIERREFFDERKAAAQALRDVRVPASKAVKDHPELLGSYAVLGRAILASRKFYRQVGTRRHAVALVREALAQAVEMGDPLPYVNPRDIALLNIELGKDWQQELTR